MSTLTRRLAPAVGEAKFGRSRKVALGQPRVIFLPHFGLILRGRSRKHGGFVATPPVLQGTIGIAYFTSSNGQRKERTVAVYTPNDLLHGASELDVMMISGSCYPDDPQIPLPWDSEGKGPTRLRKPSSLVLDETGKIPTTDFR